MGRPACQQTKAVSARARPSSSWKHGNAWWVTGSRWSARSGARTNDLEADAPQAYPHAQAMTVDRQMCVLAQVISPSSSEREPVCERPDLPRCAETSSGNMMVDRVIPTRRSCGRIVLWRLTETRSRQQSGCWSRPQIIGFVWASRKTSSPRRRSSHRREGLVAELAQAMVHPACDLSCNRERRPLSTKALADADVVLVVRSDGLGGGLGRLVERPAQHRRALAGEMTLGPLGVRGVDGDVEACVPHGVRGGG